MFDIYINSVPKSYKSTFLFESLSKEDEGSLLINVKSHRISFKKFFVNAFCPDFSSYVQIIIFNYTPYHLNLFKIEKSFYIHGNLSYSFHQDISIPTIINPKVVNDVNKIIPIPPRGIKKFYEIQEKAKINIFTKQGIQKKYAELLEKIFNPDLEFFKLNRHGLTSNYLEALKYLEAFNYIKKFKEKKIQFKTKFICRNKENILNLFFKSLPFSLTNDQIKAINDIKNDFSSGISSRRIIVGDVGCGKTIVILSSVVLMYPFKSVLMSPTGILASQLFNEAKKFLKNIKIGLISSNTKKKDIEYLLESDFLIGTQALIYQNLSKRGFGLIMIDEQHKFGVRERTMLEKMLSSKENLETLKPHILQFSATPIPRTMAMFQSKFIDISEIRELPFKKDISTIIKNKNDFKSIIEHIKFELAKNNQVIIIFPLVAESESARYKEYISLNVASKFWIKNFKNVFITHGQDLKKEEVLKSFANTPSSILLSTTMVEVGISLPLLTIIVIVAPEFLGLASLHQIRGRVSRNGLKGFCYLVTHYCEDKRLKNFTETLNGFDIAELDLKYRNSGDLLDGQIQSGNVFKYFDLSKDQDILMDILNRE